IVDDRYPHFISHFWEPPWRAQRIHELVLRKDKHDAESLMRIQQDVLTVDGRAFVAEVLRPFSTSPAANDLSAPARDGLTRLLAWERQGGVGDGPRSFVLL